MPPVGEDIGWVPGGHDRSVDKYWACSGVDGAFAMQALNSAARAMTRAPDLRRVRAMSGSGVAMAKTSLCAAGRSAKFADLAPARRKDYAAHSPQFQAGRVERGSRQAGAPVAAASETVSTAPIQRWREGFEMAKFISFARYTAQGAKGMLKNSAAAREASIRRAVEGAGGKVLSVYWTQGRYNFVLISEGEDETTGVMLQLAAQAAGIADDFETMRLFDAAAIDGAMRHAAHYKPPSG